MYVVGTQKNRLNDTVLLINQNIFKLMGKKIIAILHSNIYSAYLHGPMCSKNACTT